MDLKTNFSLKNFHTFGTETYCKYFVSATKISEIKEVLEFVKNNNLELILLGGGSNVLFTKDFEGLILQINLKGISYEINNDKVLVNAKSGENWHEFVEFCISKNFAGLENLALIPGNVGTSPIQNIGAYGVEIKDKFHFCEILNLETLELEILNKDQCKFGYRDSVFKNELKNKAIITEVCFELDTKIPELSTQYGAISTELAKNNIEKPTIRELADAVISIRQSKLPNPKEKGNAGSFFKNPTVSKDFFKSLQDKFINIPFYEVGEQYKIPAGWLIEQCGWKGTSIGNVACHHLQSLVIINNTGLATGLEIYDFSTEIIKSVQSKFGIILEREVNII